MFIKRIESGFLSNPELISNYFQSDQVEKLKFLKELYLDEINLMFNAVKKESTDKVKGKKSKSGKDVINNGLVLVDGANPDLECKSNTMEPSDVLFIEADDDQTNIPKEVKDEVANESLMEKSATLQRSFSFILPKSPRSVKNKLKDNLEIVAASNTELLIASESVQTVIDLS